MTIDISEESLSKESADLLKILLKDRTTKEKYCLGDAFL